MQKKRQKEGKQGECKKRKNVQKIMLKKEQQKSDKKECMKNKAGYTAISCGRVGRGRNTRFPTSQLERDGQTDQPTN